MVYNEELRRIVERIVHGYSPEAIGLFGSHAIGAASTVRDLDIMVVKRTSEPPERRALHVKSLLLGVMRRIDVAVYTPEELTSGRRQRYSFVHTISEQFVPLYVGSDTDLVRLGLRDAPLQSV
jgi:predicted nucleotidyltransferase